MAVDLTARFKEHVAQADPALTFQPNAAFVAFDFVNPQHPRRDALRYVWRDHHLMVTGAFGCAIYQWRTSYELGAAAHQDLTEFAHHLTADHYARATPDTDRGYVWSPADAEDRLLRLFPSRGAMLAELCAPSALAHEEHEDVLQCAIADEENFRALLDAATWPDGQIAAIVNDAYVIANYVVAHHYGFTHGWQQLCQQQGNHD